MHAYSCCNFRNTQPFHKLKYPRGLNMRKIITHFVAFCISLMASHLSASQFEKDWHTDSNYQDVITTHVSLDLTVDFKTKQLNGSIEHQLKYINKEVNQLILDTRDLDIHKVEMYNGERWVNTSHQLAETHSVKGSKLTITLKNSPNKVKIYYNSRPEASGLQWLNPEQTAGKVYPFMFSQSQAIHARSWIPIQDTPGMRVTYDAKITTDKALRPVMSANNEPVRNVDGIYYFKMPQAIPPYLIAIAAGDIHYKSMSKQTAIYSEKEYLDSAAAEFVDTQAMINASEKLYGAYRWDRYDLLILPPSFPFGGMENPRLSFITPTVIAGDKSLVSLIAHELAHSWSGNLVTNATWRDLWLNEGFTSYVENRIMEEVYGKKRAVMEQALAAQGLNAELLELPESDTILHVVIEGRDPDDAFSGVPYTKGQLFLMFLEEKFGRKKFDIFLRQYFDDHAFKSIDTKEFIQYLSSNLIAVNPGIVSKDQITTWIYKPQLPEYAPKPTSNAFEKIQANIQQWVKNTSALSDIPTAKWTVHEWLYFLNNLPKDLSLQRMELLDKAYKFTQSTNNEIAHAWLLLSIKRKYAAVNNRLENYLVTIGRRKLIVPLYKELVKEKTSRDFAKRIYKIARPGYHPLAQGTIDSVFSKAEEK